MGFRLVKLRDDAAIVEVSHATLPLARVRWNTAETKTHRTWGTLRKAKEWLSRRQKV